jgi:hypothetical protein
MKLIRPMTVNDAALTSSNVAETDHSAWNSGTTYALAARVRVVAADYHKVFESVQASNTNHNPVTDDGTWWIEVSPTNRWKMFDQSVQGQTSNSDSIAVVLQATGRIDAVALLNIDAATARVKITDAVEGVVYDVTIPLVSTSGVVDFYSWLFEPVERMSDLVLTDLPPYSAPDVEITLTATGETVLCGACILGQQRDLGGTQWSPRVGIRDYSVKQTNDFGDITVLERAFARRASFTVNVAPGFVDQLVNLLAGYRATPVVWVGDEDYAATAIYGFFKDFEVVIAGPTQSFCSLEIEGLT